MIVDVEQLKVGSVIEVRTRFGNGPIITGTIVGVEWDTDRQCKVVVYDHGDDMSWAYLDQIVRVVSY